MSCCAGIGTVRAIEMTAPVQRLFVIELPRRTQDRRLIDLFVNIEMVQMIWMSR